MFRCCNNDRERETFLCVTYCVSGSCSRQVISCIHYFRVTHKKVRVYTDVTVVQSLIQCYWNLIKNLAHICWFTADVSAVPATLFSRFMSAVLFRFALEHYSPFSPLSRFKAEIWGPHTQKIIHFLLFPASWEWSSKYVMQGGNVVPLRAMTAYCFFTLAPGGVELSCSCLVAVPLGKEPRYPWKGYWVSPRIVFGALECNICDFFFTTGYWNIY